MAVKSEKDDKKFHILCFQVLSNVGLGEKGGCLLYEESVALHDG